VDSGSFAGSLGSKANSRLSARQALANGVRCSYKLYAQTRNLTFPKSDLARLKELKLVESENLNKFYGICFNQQNEFIVLWLLCQRGSLADVLFNEEMKITRSFQVSFAKDVVKGVHFLHTSSNLKTHGFLCLQNCLVDSNWTVKLSNFVTDEIVADKLRRNELRVVLTEDTSTFAPMAKKLRAIASSGGKKKEAGGGEGQDSDFNSDNIMWDGEEKTELAREREKSRMKKFVQQAPEIIREYISTKQLPSPGTQPADMYALGMVLYQILFKVEPFYEQQANPSSGF